MNPIKALCTLLSRFIVEHGSSEIQTKNLAFLRDQLSILNKENEIIKTENRNLKSEAENLRLKIDECENLRKQLEKKLSGKSKIGSPHAFIPEDPFNEKLKRRPLSIEK